MKRIIVLLIIFGLIFLQYCSKQEKKVVPFGYDVPESIKPEIIMYGNLNYEFPKGIDITYIATVDIDSIGIPINISLDKNINSLYDSLAIKYIKSFRFKPINEYPEKIRDNIQKSARIPIKFKAKK